MAGEDSALDLRYSQRNCNSTDTAEAETKSLDARLHGHDGNGMRTALGTVCLIVAMLLSFSTFAQVAINTAPLQFQNTAEERHFHALVSELRCVMCQNQSLADSNAQIANDLRHEVLDLMRQGKSDTEVKSFLVARYGEFVLYRPQVQAKTWLLWFGPALLLLVGGLIVAAAVRRRSARATADDRDARPEDQEW